MLSGRLSSEIRFYLNRLSEKLWVKPLFACALSVLGVLLAGFVDGSGIKEFVPTVSVESIETLLSVMASSMLVIATLAVGSMVAAYSSASNTASPRAFPLIIADDISQFALSAFIGTFIYSLVGLVATKNDYYGPGGRFVLFALTVFVFCFVLFTFVTWIDRIARLGRLSTITNKVAVATRTALDYRKATPYLGGVPVQPGHEGRPVYTDRIGFIQRIDIHGLQELAKASEGRLTVAVLPGSCIAPDTPLAYVHASKGDWDTDAIAGEFEIGKSRTFDEDPRYGFVVLSQIASRALSPAVNDPGTAIDIIVESLHLFSRWHEPLEERASPTTLCDRVMVPALEISDLFDDAFAMISRDGAGLIEVATRLQKALSSLHATGDHATQLAADYHAKRALALSEGASMPEQDLERLRQICERSPAK